MLIERNLNELNATIGQVCFSPLSSIHLTVFEMFQQLLQRPREEDEEDANTEVKQHRGEGRKGREGTEEREVGGG